MAEEKKVESVDSNETQSSIFEQQPPTGQKINEPTATNPEVKNDQPVEIVEEMKSGSEINKTEDVAVEEVSANEVEEKIETPVAERTEEKSITETTPIDKTEEKIETPAAEEVERKEEEPTNNVETEGNKQQSTNHKIFTGIVVAIIVIGGAWFFSQGDNSVSDYNNFKIKVKGEAETGQVNIIEQVNPDIQVNGQATTTQEPLPTGKNFTFYLNTKNDPNTQNCERVYPLERVVEKKYDSDIINTTINLLTPLEPAEKDKGFASAIPDGTFLQYIKIDDSGNLEANFSGNIAKAAGSCAVSAIRAQITQTLSQFSQVKTVKICINGNCRQDEILQP